MKLEVPSRRLARAWRACQVAASDDQARPVLYRTAFVEVFDGWGLRLVSTDSYVLVRAWVPFDVEDDEEEPGLDEVPTETFLVSDSDLRGLGMLKYIAKQFRKELDETVIPNVVLTKQREEVAAQGIFDGFEGETVRIDWPFHEEVVLRVQEGVFPEWRSLVNERELEATDSISFTPHTLGALAKLGDLYPGYTIDWTLSGNLGVIAFKVGPVSGLLMPARPEAPSTWSEDEEPK